MYWSLPCFSSVLRKGNNIHASKMSYALVLKGRIWSLSFNIIFIHFQIYAKTLQLFAETRIPPKTLWSFGCSECNRANSWCKFEKEDKQNCNGRVASPESVLINMKQNCHPMPQGLQNRWAGKCLCDRATSRYSRT